MCSRCSRNRFSLEHLEHLEHLCYATTSHRSRRLNSRRRSHIARVSCTSTVATERYQIHRSRKSGMRESISAKIDKRPMRTPDATSDGIVLPIAWNMLDATKIKPDATKFHEMMRRYSEPTAITPGSVENAPTIAAGAM